ncbi:MAG: VIT1/CCC1 transporter family protein [Actinobacteria bacterium]|nr:VIT1/CCC1 transporter family protein [Actinomycetota bacterium]
MHEHHHRKVQGGAARAAVFGISDGLVSNVALILGVAGASPSAGIVRLAGLSGLVAGAFSMASGEYVSMRAQTELLERELEIERVEIARRPENERRELVQIYRSRGIDAELAEDLATEMHRTPQLALETHAREELGIDPDELGSPVAAAAWSFGAFATGAVLPLLPWFFTTGTAAVAASVVIGAVAAVLVGVALAWVTDRPAVRPAARQLLFASASAAVAFLVGSAVGVGTGVG